MFCNCFLFWISQQAFPPTVLKYSLSLFVMGLFSMYSSLLMISFYLRPSRSKNTSFRLSVCLCQPVCLSLSVCLSVCLSVTLVFTMFPSSYHHELLPMTSDIHARGQGQRSKVTVTEAKTQFSRFRTVTSVWIHIWWRNDAQSLMLLRRGILLFFKVFHQISRSHSFKKNVDFEPNRAFQDCNSNLNSSMATKLCTKLEVA